ncbi:glycoside hydrolase family 3 C-terminal domain-containing protein [Portibacter marinus]|uniref:glycoside hydrolase family 3 C-terminal domain-containing protein n=1 Tax=Portibacter marinus TaxID=2898660 RepID=UPI001F24EB06|nr:glycoside hydrolase family 3 C-terminal domain-containing protein [Portibacter marinus]
MRSFLLSFIMVASSLLLQSQTYPFQNIELSDDERLDNLISLMTLEEKIDHMHYRPPGIPRLGVKKTRIVEGLHGLALSGPANWAVKGEGAAPTTTFPQAIGLAQMWDPELHRKLAEWEAYETRYVTQNENYLSGGLIMLAPNADLGRDIRWGRTEECYGEDPYLVSRLTVAYVQGLQGNDPRYWTVASLMKHFLANSNENNRYFNSSDFGERLFREYYAYPFYKGITEGGSRAFMAAYNSYNGVPCTVHPMLEEIAVKEWNQNGIICTDGGAFKRLVTDHHYYENLAEAAAGCIKAGITMFLDDYKTHLREALEKGLITEAEIDKKVRGTLRVMLKIGLLDDSDQNPYSKIGIEDTIRPWNQPEAKALTLEATKKSIVLLKNDGVLPLDKKTLKKVAVIGPSADLVLSDWYAGTPPYAISIKEGIEKALGEQIEVLFAASNKADSALIAATQADYAIVCVGNHPTSYGLGWGQNHVASDGREEVDREAISLEQEDLVKLVFEANPNTILVLVSSFPYAINWSAERVSGIIHVTQSSQEMGTAIADVIFGGYSPAGRLVQTWSKSISDLGRILEYDITKGKTYLYDKNEPLFAFGHGLSYSKFDYLEADLSSASIGDGEKVKVNVRVRNIGDYDSDEVVQLYVSFPESEVVRPIKALKAFNRVHIKSGETKSVELQLDSEELKYWHEASQKYVLEEGPIQLHMGAASNDIRLKQELQVK